MAYDYRYSQRSTTANRPGRRSFLPPPPPPSRSQQHHGLFTYWIPLVVAGTFAVGGLAAWIWSERSEHDHDDYPHDKPPRPQPGIGQPYPTQGSQPYPGPPRPPPGQQGPPPSQYPPGSQQQPGGPRPPQGPPPPGGESASYYDQSQSYRQTTESRDVQQDDSTWYGRMSGMMKRTPSPQNIVNSTGKYVGAGVAAVGGALGSIVEDHESVGSDHAYGEDETLIEGSRTSKKQQRSSDRRRRTEEREGFSDHERWSEEADERQKIGGGLVEQESERRAVDARERGKGKQRKAVAVVVSADTAIDTNDTGFEYMTEHASILSHLPSQKDSSTTDVFVLIYSPTLKSLPPTDYQPNPTSTSATPATTPGSELQSISPRPLPADSPSRQFDALYSQALSLVPSSTHILPFTTKDGYVHILRHLAPGLVYISDSLAGEEGEDIAQLKGWVGHTILVAGDEGHGGLADTETETEAEGEERKGGRKDRRKVRWYDNSSLVGLGKDVEVVDATRVGEDWERRVGGRE